MWNEILRQPKPAPEALFATGLWHFTRALSLIRLGNTTAAQGEIDSLQAIAALPAMEKTKLMTLNPASRILQIGVKEARGELKAATGAVEEAIAELAEAVRLQDDLRYTEPPPWFHSVRLSLGAILLKAGRNDQAETVFREDLATFRENGWALRGLLLSLDGQGRSSLAREVKARFARAWARADKPLASPRY